MNTSPTLSALTSCNRRCFKSDIRRTARGFTLIELLMVLVVIGVFLSFAVPSFNALVGSSKLTAASNALLSSMHLARSEAIKRNGRVMLCKSADGLSCATAGGWEQGWIVFHDVNNNGEHEHSELVIQRVQPFADRLSVTGNSPVARYVSFVANGGTKLTGGGFQAGTVTVCDQAAPLIGARQIVLSAVGRPRIQKIRSTTCV